MDVNFHQGHTKRYQKYHSDHQNVRWFSWRKPDCPLLVQMRHNLVYTTCDLHFFIRIFAGLRTCWTSSLEKRHCFALRDPDLHDLDGLPKMICFFQIHPGVSHGQMTSVFSTFYLLRQLNSLCFLHYLHWLFAPEKTIMTFITLPKSKMCLFLLSFCSAAIIFS